MQTVVGLLQYKRLVQKLKNFLGTFQRVVGSILSHRRGKDVPSYIDETNIGTETEGQHPASMSGISTLLYEKCARLKLSKCSFGKREIDVLGHRVCSKRVTPSAGLVDAIERLVESASGDELMRFLALASYFFRFVDHFANLSRPLYDVLKRTGFSKKRRLGTRFVIPDLNERWGESQKLSWKAMQNSSCDLTILVPPPPTVPKKLVAGARFYGHGDVLLQEGGDYGWRTVCFTSRQLEEAELLYPVHEKECLAVVHAIKK